MTTRTLVTAMLVWLCGFVFVLHAWSAGTNETTASEKSKGGSSGVSGGASSGVSGANLDDLKEKNYRDLISWTANRLSWLTYNCPECQLSTHSDVGGPTEFVDASDPKQVCQEAWNNFYSKPTINLRLVFGSLDSDVLPTAEDYQASRVMIDQLTGPCGANVQACEFKRSADDATLFEKKVLGPRGATHTVRITVLNSSAYSSDKINRLFTDEQDKSSERAERAFFDGLCDADANLYVGHARKGGGPDFRPAVRTAKGLTDYENHYLPLHYGKNRLVQGLAQCPNAQAKVIGIMACEAEQHFGPLIRRLAPKSGTMMPGVFPSPEVNTAQAFLAIDSILWQRCQAGFNQALSIVKKYDGQKVEPVFLNGFFEQFKPSK